MISNSARIYPGVQLGNNVVIEDFCIVGVPVSSDGEETTIIGDNAVIRSHTVIYAGNNIGKGFATGNKANIREFNVIGDNVSIGTMTVVEHHVIIADNVRIHSSAFIPEYSTLGQGAWIGPNVVLTNAKYPNEPDTKMHLAGVEVGVGARVGANSTILPGVKVGDFSLVGAGSVVTNDVPAGTVCYGVPAKAVRTISR